MRWVCELHQVARACAREFRQVAHVVGAGAITGFCRAHAWEKPLGRASGPLIVIVDRAGSSPATSRPPSSPRAPSTA
eukprot:10975577-Alexandrium_andersonii.AAC.1